MDRVRTILGKLYNSSSQYAEFFRFCCVGGICTIIDWAVFSLVCFVLPYQVGVVIGFGVSFCVNYWLTALWTFKKAPTKRNFAGLITAHLINLFVVRMGVLTLLVEVAMFPERVAYIPTLIISAITSFIMVRFVFTIVR
jgi:putative flippase GtrA